VVLSPIEGELETFIDEALATRADLQALDRRIEQARVGEKIAKSGRRPVIEAGAQYALNGSNPFDPTGDNWTVGLSIRIPLLDGLESGSRAAEVRAERARAEQLRRAMVDGIELEVLAALAERTSSAQRLVVARSALKQSEEALRILRDRYSEGMAVIVELLGAEVAHTRAKANHVLALGDVAMADVGLDLVLGRTARVASSDQTES
jgi:outer membrane protein TolC